MRVLLFVVALILLSTSAFAETKKAPEPLYGIKLMAGLGLTAPLNTADDAKCSHASEGADTFLAGRAAIPLAADKVAVELELARDFNPNWKLTYRAGVWYKF